MAAAIAYGPIAKLKKSAPTTTRYIPRAISEKNAPIDRRLAVFVPSLMLLLGSVGAFLRASLRLHRLRRLYIRPYMAWLLTGLTLVYLAGAFIFIEGNIL